MKGVKLSEFEIHKKAREIVSGLLDMPALDAMMIVIQAINIIARENIAIGYVPSPPASAFNPYLRRHGQISKIDADPEIKAFIHGISDDMTIKEIAEQCQRRFGKNRAPSKSAVGRYLQKLARLDREKCKPGDQG